MIRCRALYSAGRLGDARAEAEAAIEMADEIGDGTYGYVNHMSLYILARVALHTGDAAGLSKARASAARLGRSCRRLSFSQPLSVSTRLSTAILLCSVTHPHRLLDVHLVIN